MARTVFFSWQSDTVADTNRAFIKSVLEEVCIGITSETEVNEAKREEVEVDSDTQGVAGQPPIVDTIFKKIDSASVFIADMTFVGSRKDGRPTPNPNVLIEYGWALKSLKHERVICLMNDAYGKPSRENLPFDLSHLRWPIQYSLPEKADQKTKDKEKKKLVAVLNNAIRASLATVPSVPAEIPKQFPEAEVKNPPARFRAVNQGLGFTNGSMGFGGEATEIFMNHGPAMWFRLMPVIDPAKEWSIHELKKHIIVNGQAYLTLLLSEISSYDPFLAEDGTGIYHSTSTRDEEGQSHKSNMADSMAFAFQTGEIWSIDTALLSYTDRSLFFVENYYTKVLQNYTNFLRSIGIKGPYKWIAGMTGVKGRQLDYPVRPGYSRLHGSGPTCLADTIQAEGKYDGEENPTTALIPFFKKIFEKCGIPRPDYLPQ